MQANGAIASPLDHELTLGDRDLAPTLKVKRMPVAERDCAVVEASTRREPGKRCATARPSRYDRYSPPARDEGIRTVTAAMLAAATKCSWCWTISRVHRIRRQAGIVPAQG